MRPSIETAERDWFSRACLLLLLNGASSSDFSWRKIRAAGSSALERTVIQVCMLEYKALHLIGGQSIEQGFIDVCHEHIGARCCRIACKYLENP